MIVLCADLNVKFWFWNSPWWWNYECFSFSIDWVLASTFVGSYSS